MVQIAKLQGLNNKNMGRRFVPTSKNGRAKQRRILTIGDESDYICTIVMSILKRRRWFETLLDKDGMSRDDDAVCLGNMLFLRMQFEFVIWKSRNEFLSTGDNNIIDFPKILVRIHAHHRHHIPCYYRYHAHFARPTVEIHTMERINWYRLPSWLSSNTVANEWHIGIVQF